MKLVHNWKRAWSWVSMQAMAIIVLVPMLWAELPVEIKVYIPDEWMPKVLAGVALLAMIGRLVDQGGRRADVAKDP